MALSVLCGTACDMMYRFIIHDKFYPNFCENASFVLKLGKYVSGDEKLLNFTGNAGNIRLVLSKPDRVGL